MINYNQLCKSSDCNDKWVKGFSRSIGFAISFTAEFWALKDGLKLALSAGIQSLVVELDAKVVANLLTTNGVTNRSYSPLLHDCKCLLRRFLRVQGVHVYREGNRCPDVLARWDNNMNEDFTVFDSLPSPEILCFVNIFCVLLT